jgi:hypothetical protein
LCAATPIVAMSAAPIRSGSSRPLRLAAISAAPAIALKLPARTPYQSSGGRSSSGA